MSEHRQERKVVTVLFCDLVGSTQQAEEMDPEDVASLLGAYHARVKEELERFGGTVEKFIGDAAMALFGAPVAHEDDPERAVRAALAIRSYAEEEDVELRIGIASGEALVTLGARPDEGETMAAGDVVNTAARLQSAAAVNGILVSDKIYQATKDTIEYREAEPVEAKGKAKPVPVWAALRARSRVTLDRLHGAPLVGRERELDLLVDALARARAERQPQLVTLIGVPGIGKSRLVYELSQAAERDPELISWRQGRCLPYGDGVTFWALGEIVKAQLGILETDAPEEAEGKLDRAVPEEWLRKHLGPLVGVGSKSIDEANRQEEGFAAWRHFLEEVAAQRPLVVVVEDLHWADDSFLDFVDHLVEWASGVPLLVVCTARPELLDRRSGWGGGKTNALTISLSPLSDRETARLVGALIDRAVMPAEAQEALLARAGGNPLYAEQYARLLEDAVAGELPLPETVQGIIAARLDGLEEEQKALLQDAAVLGKICWQGALAHISGSKPRALESTLHALERRGFVRRERETSIEGDIEYAFLHMLVRDVAYGQIPRAPRAAKHRLAAEWIESLGRSEDHAEMLVYHYGEALDLARSARAETASLQERARHALRDAGDRAMALNAYPSALRHYERALDLWPDDGERPALLFRRAKAALLTGADRLVELFDEARDALLESGDREAASEAETLTALPLRLAGKGIDALDRAYAAAARLETAAPSRAKAYVLANLARFIPIQTDRSDEAIDVARRSLAMAQELGLGEIEAHALNTIGMTRVLEGDPAGVAELEESLRLALAHGSPLEISRVYNNLAACYLFAGRAVDGDTSARARLEMAERFGLPSASEKQQVMQFAFICGRWNEAEQRLGELLTPAEVLVGTDPLLLIGLVELRLARDDLAGARASCERALELIDQRQQDIEAGHGRRLFLLLRARIALAEGQGDAANEFVDSALAITARPAPHVVDLALLLLDLGRSGAEVLELAASRPSDPWLRTASSIVEGRLDEAADRLAEIGSRPQEAAVRLRAAAQMVAEGRRAEADLQLQKALAFYRSVGATRYIREGEALLAATA